MAVERKQRADISVTPVEEYPLEGKRWVVLGLLWINLFLMWTCWFFQGPLLISYWGIREHVSFGNAEYLLSSVAIAGIFICLLLGRVYDHLGPRRATAICIGVITLGFGLRPLAITAFPAMLVLTITAGIGCIPLTMAPLPVISQWFGSHRMNLPLALVFSAYALGQVAGLLLPVWMMGKIGIGWAFGSLSLALLISFAAWYAFVPDAPRRSAGPPPITPPNLRQALREISRAESSWILFGIGVIYGGVIVFAGSFLPGIMTATFKISVVRGGDSTAIVPAFSVLGMLVVGYLTRRSRSLRGHGLWTAILQMVSWLAFTVSWFMGIISLAEVLFLLAVFGFCFEPCFSFGINVLEHARGIRPATVGMAAGFYFTGVSLGSYAFPTIFAGIIDKTGSGAGFIGELALVFVGCVLWVLTVLPRGRRLVSVPREGTSLTTEENDK